MAFDDDAALATEDILDALGKSVNYCLQGGGTIVAMTVILDRQPVFVETDDGAMLTFPARLSVKTSDLHADSKEGDTIVDGLTTYTVQTLEPDGLGNTDIVLSLNA